MPWRVPEVLSARKLKVEILIAKVLPEKLQANCNHNDAPSPAMALVQTDPDAYTIKPQATAPPIDTSDWPLLLKNYSECMHPLFP